MYVCLNIYILLLYTNYEYMSFFSFRDIMPSHYKVKEYCPLVFRNLRERFDIDDHDYMVSFNKHNSIQKSSSKY